jgi:hypothetical protein
MLPRVVTGGAETFRNIRVNELTETYGLDRNA